MKLIFSLAILFLYISICCFANPKISENIRDKRFGVIWGDHPGAEGYSARNQCAPICPSEHKVFSSEDDNPSIFKPMSRRELLAVRKFLLSQVELNLVDEAQAKTPLVNFISLIDLKPADKSDALSYLYENGTKPDRLARVIVSAMKSKPHRIIEYIVGNLPKPSWYQVDSDATYSHSVAPFNRRQLTTLEKTVLIKDILPKINAILRPLLLASYGNTFYNCHGKCLILTYGYVDDTKLNSRQVWCTTHHAVQPFYTYNVGLQFLYDVTSSDLKNWEITTVFYNGNYYKNIFALKDAFTEGSLQLINFPFPKGEPINADMQRHGTEDEFADMKPGPRPFEPQGRRFSLKGHHVDYRGWSLDIGMDTIHGLRLNDVTYRNERIAYEISVQQACVFYSGMNPYVQQSYYFDTSENIGRSSSPLAAGFDCPETAVFLDFDFYTTHYETRSRSVCIFEHNNGIPLRRHYADDYKGSYTFYGAMADHALVVRTIATLFNYDYIFDFIFRLNGVIQIKFSATGYPQSSFATKEEMPYGGLLNWYALANVHQHLFNLKVDFDILGTDNRFDVYDFGIKKNPHPILNEDYERIVFDVKNIKDERKAAMKYKFRKPQYYVFYNNNKTNSYGKKRAFRIVNDAVTPMLLGKISRAGPAAWAKYQIATTVHHPDELYSTHYYNTSKPQPVVNFDRYLEDNESIVDQDLVAWVTVGTYHLPSAEDNPVTPTSGNQFSVYLRPFNFFDESPDSQSRDSILNDNIRKFTTFYGIPRNISCVPPSSNVGIGGV